MHLIHNVTVFDSDATWLLFDSTIESMGTGEGWKAHASNAEVIDGELGFVSRPLIETHTHGLLGYAPEGGLESMRAIRASQKKFGIGRSILSLVSLSQPKILERISDAKQLAEEDIDFLGLHLEGPYIAKSRCGAHDPEVLRKPTDAELNQLIEAGEFKGGNVIASMTVAPELFEQHQLALLRNAGIRLCLGHTECSYAEAAQFFAVDGKILTHTFNAMPGIGHRAPGPIPAAMEAAAFMELIVDNEHVQKPTGALLDRDHVVLVSDSMSAAGLTDGEYQLGNLKVQVSGSVARTETGALAGSTLTLDVAVANYADWLGDSMAAIRSATTIPASAYGLEVPSISTGQPANLVLFDKVGKLRRSFNL